jgi:hypothetical protein
LGGPEPPARHEKRDFKPAWVGAFVIALVYVIVVVCMLTFMVFSRFKTEPAAENNAGLFPKPRLQVDSQSDLNQMQARDREVLNSYAWIDRDTGVVRIPIERAMDLVAERGLEGGAR